MGAEARCAELKLELPPPTKPAGTYVPAVRLGNLLYVSGHGPNRPDGTSVRGVVGQSLSEAEGKEAARAVGLRGHQRAGRGGERVETGEGRRDGAPRL